MARYHGRRPPALFAYIMNKVAGLAPARTPFRPLIEVNDDIDRGLLELQVKLYVTAVVQQLILRHHHTALYVGIDAEAEAASAAIP